jgi:hypothetical protein
MEQVDDQTMHEKLISTQKTLYEMHLNITTQTRVIEDIYGEPKLTAGRP